MAQPMTVARESFKRHKGRRPAPGDERIDALLGALMALTSEVAVLRERLDAHERIAARGEVATPEAVDAFVPDEAVSEARGDQRKRLIDKVCRPLIAGTD